MERPWVIPEDVRDYSDSAKVKSRSDKQLAFDIARAEKAVIFFTHNKFNAKEYEQTIPEDVQMAVIILAEAISKQAIIQRDGVMQSETFDDYSYTASQTNALVESLDLGTLLDEYVLEEKGESVLKLRKL